MALRCRGTCNAARQVRSGQNDQTVLETGIYNLTKDETPVLVHFGKEKTQQWPLVRLEDPQGAEGSS